MQDQASAPVPDNLTKVTSDNPARPQGDEEVSVTSGENTGGQLNEEIVDTAAREAAIAAAAEPALEAEGGPTEELLDPVDFQGKRREVAESIDKTVGDEAVKLQGLFEQHGIGKQTVEELFGTRTFTEVELPDGRVLVVMTDRDRFNKLSKAYIEIMKLVKGESVRDAFVTSSGEGGLSYRSLPSITSHGESVPFSTNTDLKNALSAVNEIIESARTSLPAGLRKES